MRILRISTPFKRVCVSVKIDMIFSEANMIPIVIQNISVADK